jgi:hypothetical protein
LSTPRAISESSSLNPSKVKMAMCTTGVLSMGSRYRMGHHP